VLVRAGFLIPSTLSLYLLPRFVRNRDNPRLSRVGVLVTLGLSLATSGAMILVFALFGDALIELLYGSAYSGSASLLVPAALAYTPWIAAQGLLIKMTSSASRAAMLTLLVATVAQWVTFTVVIPNVPAMLVAYGFIGAAVLTAFLILEALHTRRIAVSGSDI
jgi:O-antigen/teichoic acid export membrane protein